MKTEISVIRQRPQRFASKFDAFAGFHRFQVTFTDPDDPLLRRSLIFAHRSGLPFAHNTTAIVSCFTMLWRIMTRQIDNFRLFPPL